MTSTPRGRADDNEVREPLGVVSIRHKRELLPRTLRSLGHLEHQFKVIGARQHGATFVAPLDSPDLREELERGCRKDTGHATSETLAFDADVEIRGVIKGSTDQLNGSIITANSYGQVV